MPKSVTEYILTSQRPRFVEPLTIKGSFLWASDIEIPFHDADFINNCIAIAKAYEVKQAVFGGDFCHWDSFSPFPGADTDTEQEITEIDEHLPQFLEPFEKILWIMGNHDQRAQRALNRKVTNEQALRMMVAPETMAVFHKKVTTSEYFWMDASYNWRLEHAANNRVMPAGTAKALAERFHKNIVMGHTHKTGWLQDVSGTLQAIESGCCVDIKKLAYPNLRHSTHTAMVNGAVLMLDTGRQYSPLLLNKFTDWQYEKYRAGKLKAHL